MRLFKVIIVIFFGVFLVNCTQTNKKQNFQYQSKAKSNHSGTYVFAHNKNAVLQVFIDSLNAYKIGDNLPFFLNLYSFDEDVNFLWPHPDTPISLRKIIFSKVTNQKVLTQIINSSSKNYDYLIDTANNQIPLQNCSNRDLAIKRLRELQNSN